MKYSSPNQGKLLKHCLKMAMLFALSIMCSSCMRFLNSAWGGDAFLSINRPYFFYTRKYVKEIVSPTDGKSGMAVIALMDLPFTFAVDALVEVPWMALNDVMKPFHEMEKNLNSSDAQLYYINLETLFEQGLKQKKSLFHSDDYYKVFQKRIEHGEFDIDIDSLVLLGQKDKDYLSRYLVAIVKRHKKYGLVYLNKYKYLEHNMLPVYRYLLSHGLKPADYWEECAVYYAVINYLYRGENNPQQLKLIELLLKKGCKPNAIQEASPYTYSIGPNSVNDFNGLKGVSINRSYNALDLACNYLELSKSTEPPDKKAIESANALIRLLLKHGAKHSKSCLDYIEEMKDKNKRGL